MKVINLKLTKKIYLVLLLSINFSFYFSQTAQDFKNSYKDYYSPKLYKVTPNKQWGIITNESDSLGYFVDLINFKTKQVDRVAKGSKYHFLDNSKLLIHSEGEKLHIRDLKTSVEQVVDSVASCEVLDEERVILVINKNRDCIKFLNFDGDVIWRQSNVVYLDIRFKDSKIFFATQDHWGSYDFSKRKEVKAETKEKFNWISTYDDKLIGLLKDTNSYRFLLNDIKTSRISYFDLPKPVPFDVSSKLVRQMEIRNNQFLIIPVGIEDKSKKELSEIYYTNKNSESRYNKRMLGIYDLKHEKWKWLPDYKNPYLKQIFVNNGGDFIQYDPYSDPVDSLNNPRTKIELIRNFGEVKKTLKNQYYIDNSFYYDEETNHLLFFEKMSWWSENLATGQLTRIPLDEKIEQALDQSSYLDDLPAGDIYPTVKRGVFIVQTQGHMYYWDIVKNSVRTITNGDGGVLEYKMMPLPVFWSLRSSVWSMQRRDKINIDKPFLIRVQNKLTYETGIVKVDGTKNILITNEAETIRNIFQGSSSVMYSTSSFNKPLEVYVVQQGIKTLLYKSSGRFEKVRPYIKKELIHYRANGKLLNAFLFYPQDYNLQKKYPLIVKVYEKETENYRKDLMPGVMDATGINIMHYVMNGYFVLIPDLDNAVNDGKKALINSMNAVMENVVENSMIDRDKIGVIGFSFGGYTSGLMIGRTSWFATAVMGAPIVDVVRNSFTINHIFNTFKPDFYRVERQQGRMNSHVFENWEGYLEASPIYYIPKITQPILIWGGGKDTNIPSDQPQSYFLGLKRLQKKGVYINYPKENHGFSLQENIEDINYKIWQWFEYTLNKKPAMDWIIPLEKK